MWQAFIFLLGMSPALAAPTSHQLRVDQVGSRLLSKLPESKIRFLVTQKPSVLAQAQLNGTIVMGEELLAQIESEDELAALLAHEIGHLVLRHELKSWLKLGLATSAGLAAAWLLKAPEGLGVAALGGLYLVRQKWRRESELQADQFALELLPRAGYNPWAFVQLLERFRTPDWPHWLQGYPEVSKRIEEIRLTLQHSLLPK